MKAGSRCSAAHQARPFAALERDLADQMLVRGACGLEHEAVAGLVHEIDEARVDRARVGEQPHHRAQHFVELERRRDGRDDLLQTRASRSCGRPRADRRTM